ncbi:hypothetical protein GCM10009678_77890 [Actinomadura kijaniata]|uniref:Uncharacterized protein n=1 Tax=Actinomadura namibiensis TaxID=182080 RepID=A0A7W3QPU2_ACTNM|nr:hypothetical protein [Actinomadura namibiensis]
MAEALRGRAGQREPAVYGGAPVRSRPWTPWPRLDAETERTALAALRSGSWAIREMHTGRELYERSFARAFADGCGSSTRTPLSWTDGFLRTSHTHHRCRQLVAHVRVPSPLAVPCHY